MSANSSTAARQAPDRGGGVVGFLADWIAGLGSVFLAWIEGLGSLSLFAMRTLGWLFGRLPRRETILPNFYQIGVLSLPVVALTGTFIGMVLAEQSYAQFRAMHMETRLGSLINVSLFRELGPVLAATMLAGRVGSAMAAELGTMRVTEQIDALSAMGTAPLHYLVVPRFLGCLVLIPALTVMGDFVGVVGGWFYSVYILGIDYHYYWENAQQFVGLFDFFSGIVKSLFFGAAIGMISCYRGFHCEPGAEGVGRAATQAFVHSFVCIFILDLLLSIVLDAIYTMLWPHPHSII
jgi:phospholipid/cholesterol/gamma-HCH transport system permease protein